jgi:hypothetical protein
MNRSIDRFPPPMPVLSGVFGILLLLPATGFLLALLVRVCFGATAWYHSMSPSFLQSPFDLFAWHKAQFIFCCLLLAAIGNLPATLQIRLGQGRRWPLAFKPQGHWLNTAIAMQSLLLLTILTTYTMIQHIRY